MTSTDTTPLTQIELSREPGAQLSVTDDGATIRRSILPGGVRVITESVPGLRSASIGMWVGVGSRDESRGHEGSTHFLEHLLFKGTRSRSASEIAESFDMIGGESNAATAKEHTCYYARVQGDDGLTVVDILSDMVTSSTLSRDDVETERGVIISELADAADDPRDVANEAWARASFGLDTPLGRPIGGTPATVTAVSRDAIWEHYTEHYASDALVVAAAGNVDHDEICERIMKDLETAGWDTSHGVAPRPRRFETVTAQVTQPSDVVIERDAEQCHLYLTTPGIPARDEQRWTMSMLTTILGGGMSSRLFQEIREKRGLAYTTYAFDSSYAGAGAFGIYAGCAPQNVDDVWELMIEQCQLLAERGVTDREMARARAQIRGSMVLGGEDSMARMGRLGRAEVVTGRLRSMDENLARLEAVTAQDVQALAARLMRQHYARVLVGPALSTLTA